MGPSAELADISVFGQIRLKALTLERSLGMENSVLKGPADSMVLDLVLRWPEQITTPANEENRVSGVALTLVILMAALMMTAVHFQRVIMHTLSMLRPDIGL